MKYLEEIKEMLCEELEKIGKKGELSAGSLDIVHKLTDTIKNIDKIEMLEDSGHSYGKDGGMWEAYGTYDGRRDDGYSEARGRTGNVKRDSMGRYSKDGRYDDNMSYRKGYSRDDAKSEMMHNLEEIMEMASTPQERNIIRGAVEKLERM